MKSWKTMADCQPPVVFHWFCLLILPSATILDNTVPRTSSTDHKHLHHQPLKGRPGEGRCGQGRRTKGGRTHIPAPGHQEHTRRTQALPYRLSFSLASIHFLFISVRDTNLLCPVPVDFNLEGRREGQTSANKPIPMTGVGTGPGPKTANGSGAQDFSRSCWDERSRYLCCHGYWELAPGAVSSHVITS